MDYDSLFWIGSIVAAVLLFFALAYLVYLLFRTSYLLPDKDQAYIRTGFGGEKIAHGKGIFIFPGMHKKLLVDMKTHKITVERKNEHASITSDRLRIDIKADFLVRVIPEISKISLAGQTLGKAAHDEKLLTEQIQGTCVEALRDATAKMTFEALHTDNQQFNDLVENALADDLAIWGLQLEAISIAELKQTDLQYFDKNNTLDVEGLTKVKEKIAENEKKQSLIEAEKIKEVEKNQLDAHREVLRIQEEKALAEQEQELAIAETELATERKKEQAWAAEQIAIAEAKEQVSNAWIKAHETKAKEVAKKEEIQTSLLTTKAQQNKQVRIISADLEAARTRILAEAEKDADVLRAKAASARYTVDAEGKKALNEAANILSDKQISMKVKEKIVKKLPDIIRESVKPIKNIDGIKIMQIDGMSHIAGGAGAAGNGGGGGGSLSDQIVDSALRYKAQAPMVDNLLKHVGLSGAGIKDFTTELQKEMDFTPEKAASKRINKSRENSPREIDKDKVSEVHSYSDGMPVEKSAEEIQNESVDLDEIMKEEEQQYESSTDDNDTFSENNSVENAAETENDSVEEKPESSADEVISEHSDTTDNNDSNGNNDINKESGKA